MNKIHQAVDLNNALSKNSDMTLREDEILKEITKLTGFRPQKNIWRSKYWGKNLGASHWLGNYKGKESVLKIQGVKPDIDEVFMINAFTKQNKSKIVRPPIIYKDIRWSDIKEYGATIVDFAKGGNVLVDGKLVTKEKVSIFFSYYREYRKQCLPKKPWLPKPPIESNWNVLLEKLLTSSLNAFPDNAFRQSEDADLARKAYELLSNVYKDVELEFMHGHFSCKDLIYENKENDNVVLFSNLFWKWRYPYFDAVFAYHWFMYELAHVKNISPTEVEEQRAIWLDEIYKATDVVGLDEKTILLKAALLERSVAGFIIDSFLIDSKKEIARYLYESTKSETKRLINELS